LRLPAALAGELAAAVETGYPVEVCGLLLGAVDGASTEVAAIRGAGNLARERARDRYELDPSDLLAAELEARRRGLDVVGVWHSHPDHPAVPSAPDLAAAWEGWSYVIVPVAAGRAGAPRSWRLEKNSGGASGRSTDGSRFVEEAVVVDELPRDG
jgi:proteasome lid subunit RPN8/RPN11